MKYASLKAVLSSLESGARPKGGVSADSGEIPSIGGEHVNANGGFDFANIKRIPRSFYEAMPGGRIARLDILIVKDGATTGKTSLVREDFPFDDAAVNEHVFCARVDPEKASPIYVYHFLRSAPGQKAIQLDFRGATVGGITREFATKTLLPLPPLADQRRIAELLDRADSLRAERRATIAQLDSLIQALFFDLFGDPLTNPRAWPTSTVGAATAQVTDGEHLTPKRTTEGIKLLSARNVRDGYIDFENVDFVGNEEHERIKRRCNPTLGDILISCSGTIGRVASVETREPFSLVRSVALVRPDPKVLCMKFLEHYLRTPVLKAHMVRRANASSQANLFQGQIRGLPLFIPPLALQQKFASCVAAIENLKATHRASLAELDALFAAIQYRAFRGEL